MDDHALILTPANDARRANRLYTDNTDKTATTRPGTGYKLMPGAGIARVFRKTSPKTNAPRPFRLRRNSRSTHAL